MFFFTFSFHVPKSDFSRGITYSPLDYESLQEKFTYAIDTNKNESALTWQTAL